MIYKNKPILIELNKYYDDNTHFVSQQSITSILYNSFIFSFMNSLCDIDLYLVIKQFL
jgi:hypothetical protein